MSSDAGPPPMPIPAQNFPDLNDIFGTMMIGVFLNCILFGIMIMQAFIYYQTYTQDRKWLKCFVAYLCIAEAANTGANMYLIYEPTIKNFGKIEAITMLPVTLAAAAFVTVAISSPVQIFMAWRIRVITQTWTISAIIVFFSLASFAGGCWVTSNVVTLKTFAAKETWQFNGPGVMWFVASAIADVLITVTLVFTLSRRKTGHSKTTSAVNRIIRLTIQTGLITMLFALMDLLLFTISQKTAISFVFDFSVSKLYSNALLSSLNARSGWDKLNGSSDDDNVLFGATTGNFSRGNTGTFVSSHGPNFASRSQISTGFSGVSGMGRKPNISGSTFIDSYELKNSRDKSGEVTVDIETQVHSEDYRKGNAL